MTSSGLKKKKKKAAKKKKKKLNKNNKDKGVGININFHSSTTTIQQQETGEVDLRNQETDDGKVNNSCNSKLIQEESGFSSIGLVLESKSMEGSGSNGIEKSETEPPKKEEVVVVESKGDSVSRTVSIEVVGEIAKEESCNGDSFVDDDDDEKLLGSSTLHEEPKMIEKAESLKEEELEKSTELLKEEELEKSVIEEIPEVDTVEEKIVPSISEVVTDDPVEKVVLVSEKLPKVVKDIPIVEKTNNLEANELLQKDSDDKIVETPVVVSVPIVEEAKNLEANELLQKESVETPVMKSVVIKKTEASCEPASNESVDKDVAASLDAPNVETEVAEESGITERSQDEPQENVLIVPPMVQKATWKSCCGLFEAVSSSDR